MTSFGNDRFNKFLHGDEGLHALLIFLIIIIFLIYPLQALGYTDLWLVKIFLSLFTIAGIWTMNKNTSQRLILILLAVIHLAFLWYRSVSDGQFVLVSSMLLTILFIALLALFVLMRTMAPGPVNLYRIEGSIVVYLLIGVLFSNIYTLIYTIDDSAFNFSNPPASLELAQSSLTYFSFITLTTIGYGDIQPVLSFAQSMAIMEGLVGQLFPAILIARLVSQSISNSK